MNSKPTRPITLVLGPRQITLGILTLILLMWSFATITSLIAPVVYPEPVAAQPAAPGERVILVDPLVAGAVRQEKVVEVAPVSLEAERVPEPVTGPDLAGAAGRLYLQVASVNRDLAAVYVEYLSQRDIPAFVSNNPVSDGSWVMVGPIQDGEHLARLQSALSAAGFDSL